MRGKRRSKGKPEILTSIFACKAEKKRIAHDRDVKDGTVLLGRQDRRANPGLRALPGRLDPPAARC
jgi:hypothetical protein